MEMRNLTHALQRFWRERGCVELQPFDGPLHAAGAAPSAFLRLFGEEPWFASQCLTVRCPRALPVPDRRSRLVRRLDLLVHLKPAPPRALPLVLESLRAAGAPPEAHALRLLPSELVDDALGLHGAGFVLHLDGLEFVASHVVDRAPGENLGGPRLWVTYRIEDLALLLQLPRLPQPPAEGEQGPGRLLVVDDLKWQLGWRYGAIFGDADLQLEGALARTDPERAAARVAAWLERAAEHLRYGAPAAACECLAAARYELEVLGWVLWPAAAPPELLASLRGAAAACARGAARSPAAGAAGAPTP